MASASTKLASVAVLAIGHQMVRTIPEKLRATYDPERYDRPVAIKR
jgi:hypothetical protein